MLVAAPAANGVAAALVDLVMGQASKAAGKAAMLASSGRPRRCLLGRGIRQRIVFDIQLLVVFSSILGVVTAGLLLVLVARVCCLPLISHHRRHGWFLSSDILSE